MEAAAITPNQDFMDLRVRAEFLELCGDVEAAQRLRNLSIEIAREVDLTCYSYQLLWRDRVDDAIALLRVNATVHPQSWNIHDSLAEAYEQKGDVANAIASYRNALRLVDLEPARERIEHRIAVLSRVH